MVLGNTMLQDNSWRWGRRVGAAGRRQSLLGDHCHLPILPTLCHLIAAFGPSRMLQYSVQIVSWASFLRPVDHSASCLGEFGSGCFLPRLALLSAAWGGISAHPGSTSSGARARCPAPHVPWSTPFPMTFLFPQLSPGTAFSSAFLSLIVVPLSSWTHRYADPGIGATSTVSKGTCLINSWTLVRSLAPHMVLQIDAGVIRECKANSNP